jgi:hypothetical protein
MKAGSRIAAVLLAAVVWLFAGVSVATGPLAQQQAQAPSVLDVAACAVVAVVD